MQFIKNYTVVSPGSNYITLETDLIQDFYAQLNLTAYGSDWLIWSAMVPNPTNETLPVDGEAFFADITYSKRNNSSQL